MPMEIPLDLIQSEIVATKSSSKEHTSLIKYILFYYLHNRVGHFYHL